jgi:F-type H+-transporting ATPase subunit b
MEKLGIDPVLITVQIINFVLLFVILKKVLYKPILSVIKNRRSELENLDKRSLDLEKSQKEFEEKSKKILAEVQEERKQIILTAKREAEEEKRKIIEKANVQAKEIITGTEKQVERDKKKKEVDVVGTFVQPV